VLQHYKSDSEMKNKSSIKIISNLMIMVYNWACPKSLFNKQCTV